MGHLFFKLAMFIFTYRLMVIDFHYTKNKKNMEKKVEMMREECLIPLIKMFDEKTVNSQASGKMNRSQNS